ncbi:hypothetical protein [Actibacterium sp. 188UL27-1]|uniref:hypothetical protein n=1 Tax=Actibacterium sp. 188UL27-1 TaxID=2786961 RepID=UPI00195DB6AB|nr:hypothetical protein [Actibacterium sp. 188UL27-1]MBM7069820.1 hypothetical protein [Actibacterium sp. 188UL27-1]
MVHSAVRSPFSTIHYVFAALALAVAVFAVSPALARQPTAQDKVALEAAVKTFDRAVTRNDAKTMVSFMPPRLVSVLAGDAKMSPTRFRQTMVFASELIIGQFDLVSFTMSLKNARYGETSAGRPYALLPTSTVVRVPNVGRVRGTSATVGVFDNNRWYLVRVENDQQRRVLLRAYPDFRRVNIPRARKASSR